MTEYILRRALQALAALVVASVIVFLMVRVTGDPVRFFVSMDATPEQIEAVRERLGLSDPLLVQYLRFVGGVVQGDLGHSFRYRAPVNQLVAERLGPTLSLVGSSMVFAVVLAVPLGVVAAARRSSGLDQLIGIVAMLGQAMPVFWSALLLILYVAVPIAWIPTGGYGDITHYLLPTVSLGAYLLARMVRLVRSSMLESLREDYIRTARSKGVSERVVVYKHALKNAAIPVVTVVGLQIGSLLGGAIVTENIFAWAGMGTLIVNSVFGRDYPVIQAVVLIFAVLFALINLGLDLVYALLDPRIRYG